MLKSPLRVIQLSDSHLFADKEKSLLGVQTEKSFTAVVDAIKKEHARPDCIIFSGDISQDGSKESYIRFANIISSLDIPIYCIPGNHDDRIPLNKVFPYKNLSSDKQIIIGPWQFILLDSHKPGAVEGYLQKGQFDFLRDCLEKQPDSYSVIILHHHPIHIGVSWLDKLGLDNANQFWDVLNQFPQVKAVLFGHVHQAHQGEKNGIPYFSAPSTCIQFKPNRKDFELDALPQGYRLLEFYPDGQFQTRISRLEKYIGKFDKDAKGY